MNMSTRKNRKWTSEECKKILDYLRLHPFEKPANVYYKKMTQELSLKFSSDLVRKKVSYLISMYNKAKDLIKCREEFPTAEVLRICPYYRQLHELLKEPGQTRRKTTCTKSRTPVRNSTLLQPEETATDLDDSLFECSMISARMLVELPSDTSAIVKEEQENTNLAPSEPMDTAPNSIEIPSSEQPAQRENTHNQPVGGGESNDAIVSENEDIQGFTAAASSNEESDQATTVEQGCHTSEQDIKIMEMRLREKELMVKILEIESNERLARLQVESKERIIMRKLDLKYANT